MSDPKTDQETAIVRYRDEKVWTVDAWATLVQGKLERLGYKPIRHEGPYRVYRLPLQAISFRSEKTIRSMAERAIAASKGRNPFSKMESRTS